MFCAREFILSQWRAVRSPSSASLLFLKLTGVTLSETGREKRKQQGCFWHLKEKGKAVVRLRETMGEEAGGRGYKQEGG